MKPLFYYPYEQAYIAREDGEEIPEMLGEALFLALPFNIRDNKIVVVYPDIAVMFYDGTYRCAPVEKVKGRCGRTLPKAHLL